MPLERKKHKHPKLPINVQVKLTSLGEVISKTYESFIIGDRLYNYHPTKGWRNRNKNIVLKTPIFIGK